MHAEVAVMMGWNISAVLRHEVCLPGVQVAPQPTLEPSAVPAPAPPGDVLPASGFPSAIRSQASTEDIRAGTGKVLSSWVYGTATSINEDFNTVEGEGLSNLYSHDMPPRYPCLHSYIRWTFL